jgi:3-oxoacyl-[acyl-carrier protein] reductase
MLDAVLERHGRLDVLINNAVACTQGSFEDRTADEIAAMYGIILQASTMLIHLALPSLKSTKGCVINISSVSGRAVPFPPMGLSVYSAAKAGVNQLTRALASELGIFGIRVNAIAPGPTAGEPSEIASHDNPSVLQPFIDATPLGRYGQPADIAALAMFLASDAGGWVSGQVIDASGGWHISP